MKKMFLLLIIFCSFSHYTYAYDKFLDTLKLTEKQYQKIERIENGYSGDVARINAEILLNNMQIAQLRVRPNSEYQIRQIYAKSKALEDELSEIKEDKNQEIMSCLTWLQKRKYKKFLSKSQ